MALSKQHALIAIMLIVPVICCFVGAGAFIHIVLADEEVEQQKQIELRRQRGQKAAELQQQLAILREVLQSLRQKIAEVEKKIRELSEKLLQAAKDRDTARGIERQITCQKEMLAKLLAELSGIRDQIEQMQKQIDALKSEVGEAGPLDARLKKLQRQLDDLKKRLEEAQAEHQRLNAQRNDLRRQRDEAENEARILPPSDGRTPTPLYVECNAQGAVIQPEGVQFDASPDAASRSRFLAAARRTGYVVFLIRPNGFESFEMYKGLLQKEKSLAFGLEPVDASWNLVYPK